MRPPTRRRSSPFLVDVDAHVNDVCASSSRRYPSAPSVEVASSPTSHREEGGAPATLPTNLPSPLRFNLDAVLDADPAPILTRITIGIWRRCSPCRWSTAGPVPQKSLRVMSGPASSISSPTSSPTDLPSHASWKMSSPVSLISSPTSGPTDQRSHAG